MILLVVCLAKICAAHLNLAKICAAHQNLTKICATHPKYHITKYV